MSTHLPSRRYLRLIRFAKKARKCSIAPFSNFHVGAAILSRKGEIITGCNIESSSLSLTICAERTALFKALSEKVTSFTAIAIFTDTPTLTPPCGACRQVLADLAGGDIDVVLANGKSEPVSYKLRELLPVAFDSTLIK